MDYKQFSIKRTGKRSTDPILLCYDGDVLGCEHPIPPVFADMIEKLLAEKNEVPSA